MKPIELLEPPDGFITLPQQKHSWPPDQADRKGGPAGSFDWQNLQILGSDRSLPHPVSLAWKRPALGLGPVTYNVGVSRAADLSDARILKGTKTRTEFWHAHLGVKYYWKVTASRFGKAVAESPVWSFTTDATPLRWIRVPGMTNMRDIGGWPLAGGGRIRQGEIYRSSEMNGSLQITASGRRILEDDLCIRTDLDLRGLHEASPALDADKVDWINVPISPYDSICDEAFKDGYRRIFDIFADASRYPIVFHCVGGADRGGTVAFLLNALLGKEREYLFMDYELTSLSIWGERSRLSEQFNAMLSALAGYADDRNDVNVQVNAYIRSIGVSEKNVAAIRSQLVV